MERNFTNGKVSFEFFDDRLIALNEEVAKHPDLGNILGNQPNRDIYILLAEISSFCGIVLDGDYTKQDILDLAEILTKKLYERRTGIIQIQ